MSDTKKAKVEKNIDARLLKAVKKNDVLLIKNLLSSGANIKTVDSKRWTPLHYAALENKKNSHFETMETLLEFGADVNAQDIYGKVPLIYLVRLANVKAVRLLLDHGATVNIKDSEGENPLFYAIRGDNTEVAKFLLERGSDVNFRNTNNGRTALHTACKYCNETKIIKELLKSGAGLDALDHKGFTPLVFYLKRKFPNTEIVKFLLEHTNISAICVDYDIFDICYNEDFWEIIIHHIAKLQTLQLAVPKKILEAIAKRSQYKSYYEQCEKDLSAMKSCKLNNSWITYFDILMANSRILKNCAGNQDIVDNFETDYCEDNFFNYAGEIRGNFERGIPRRELFDKSSISLSRVLPIFNPNHLIIRDILDCVLSKKDLSKFCE